MSNDRPNARLSLVVACALLTSATAGAQTIRPDETVAPTVMTFSQLAAAYVNESEKHDPLFADGLGIHRYDDKLDDYSATGHAARIAWLGTWRVRIGDAIAKAPGREDNADAHALLDSIDLELFENETLAPWRTSPTDYTSAIGQAAYSLTGRTFAPLGTRMQHLAARLAAIPGIVTAAEANLTHPTRVATLQAIDANAGNVALYTSLTSLAKTTSPTTRAAIAKQLPSVLAALDGFTKFLKTTLLPRSNGNPRVGAVVFDREMLLANGTDRTRADLVAEAQADFTKNRAEMLRLAIPFDRTFFPKSIADETKSNAVDVVVRRVLDKLAGDHPKRTEIFNVARSDVDAAQAFLAVHPVIVPPVPSTLHVVATPAFMAGFSGASLDPAGPFTPLGESFYYIDTIPKSWSDERVASYLRDYNTYELKMLSMHEAMPGHYLQFRANSTVPSLVRRAFPNGSFAEGWAVYIEGMMLDAGYGDNDPRLRLFQLKWRLREEANTLIDAGFHTGDLTEARCHDLLERQAYQEKSEAQTKWHRLQLSHDQLSSYYTGLSAIRRVEAAERVRLGPAFDVATFNARLLAMGSVEPRYIATLLEPASP